MHSKITISLHDILLPKIPQVSIKKDKTTKHPPPQNQNHRKPEGKQKKHPHTKHNLQKDFTSLGSILTATEKN